METSEIASVEYELMELSDEDLLLVSGGATVTIQGPNVLFGGTVGGGNTVAVIGKVTATASATGLSFGGATAAGGIVIAL
jgi:hypothetical protein